MEEKKKLGEILLEAGVIDKFQLKSALAEQNKWGGRLGNHLVQMGILTEELLVKALSKQLKIPNLDLAQMAITPDTLELVPQELAEKFHLVPVAVKKIANKKTLIVAMSDPTNLDAVDELQFRTGHIIKPAVAGDTAIEMAIRRHYYGEDPAPPRGTPIDFDPNAAGSRTNVPDPNVHVPPEQTFGEEPTESAVPTEMPLEEASLADLGMEVLPDAEPDAVSELQPDALPEELPAEAAEAYGDGYGDPQLLAPETHGGDTQPEWQAEGTGQLEGGAQPEGVAQPEGEGVAQPESIAPEGVGQPEDLAPAAPDAQTAWAEEPAPLEGEGESALPYDPAAYETSQPALDYAAAEAPAPDSGEYAAAAPESWGAGESADPVAESYAAPDGALYGEDPPVVEPEGEAPPDQGYAAPEEPTISEPDPGPGGADGAWAAPVEEAPAWTDTQPEFAAGDPVELLPVAEPSIEPSMEGVGGPIDPGPAEAAVDAVEAAPPWSPGDAVHTSLGAGGEEPYEATMPGEPTYAGEGYEPPQDLVPPEEVPQPPEANGYAHADGAEDPLARIPFETGEGRAVRALCQLLMEKGLLTAEEVAARLRAVDEGG